MTKVNASEMRNVNGGATCVGCKKYVHFGAYWLHKLYCIKYRQWKAGEDLKKAFGW